jgi:hypothetical protein
MHPDPGVLELGLVAMGAHKWHRFPDFLASGTIDDLISPAILGTIRFCEFRETSDMFRPPMMRDVRMVSRHQSLRKVDIIVVRGRDTSMETLGSV